MPINHSSGRTLTLIGIFFTLIITSSSEEKTEKLNRIDFEVHSGYFVSNKFEPKKPQSFVVTAEKKSFDSAFGVAFVQGD